MSVNLTANFLHNARGITLEDGGGITWSINKNSNQISANGSGAGATGANPSAKVGLSTVNGTATTFMRSDGAPPIDESISPTWTGNHTFTPGAGVAISINGVAATTPVELASANTTALADFSLTRGSSTANNVGVGPNIYLEDTGAPTATMWQHSGGQTEIWQYNGSWAQILKFTPAGLPVFGKPLASGFGTPTGASILSNFPGASATLAQTSAAVAEIYTLLKTAGLIAA